MRPRGSQQTLALRGKELPQPLPLVAQANPEIQNGRARATVHLDAEDGAVRASQFGVSGWPGAKQFRQTEAVEPLNDCRMEVAMIGNCARASLLEDVAWPFRKRDLRDLRDGGKE